MPTARQGRSEQRKKRDSASYLLGCFNVLDQNVCPLNGKEKTVADNTQNIPASQFINSLSEASKAIMDMANTRTDYNITLMQNFLENSAEILKTFVKMMQQQLEQLRKQYSGTQGFELVDKMIEVQQRNLAFVQSALENGIEILKSQAELMRAFMQTLGQPLQKTQNTAGSTGQGWLDNYMNLLFAPLSFYQQGLQATAKAAPQGFGMLQPAAWWQQMGNQQQTQAAQAQNGFPAQSAEAVMSLMFAPLTLYQQMLQTMSQAFQKQVENWQQVSPANHREPQEASR